MKLLIITALYTFSIIYVQAVEICSTTEPVAAKNYWYDNAVSGTTIFEDGEEYRTWYTGTKTSECFRSKQSDINSPGTIYTGYIMALNTLGSEFSPENAEKIKKITGITFTDQKNFNYWLKKNSRNLFWSFEKNRMIVLENGFRCKKIVPAEGTLYWFNYSLGSINDMDTSSDKRLWSDRLDSTKCFISPLNSINDPTNRYLGFKLALLQIGEDDDFLREQIIKRYLEITGNDEKLLKKLVDGN